MHLHVDDALRTSFDSIYKAIKTDLVEIDFFALLCLAEFDTDKFDVVISSPRLFNNKEGLTYLNDTIARYITKSDFSQLSKLVILEDSPPILAAWHRQLQTLFTHLTSDKPVVLENYSLGNLFVKRAYIYESNQPKSRNLQFRPKNHGVHRVT